MDGADGQVRRRHYLYAGIALGLALFAEPIAEMICEVLI